MAHPSILPSRHMRYFNNGLKWSEEEIDFLIKNWYLPERKLVKYLKRRPTAIKTRVALLKRQGKIHLYLPILAREPIWYQWEVRKPNEINENQLSLF